MTERPLAYGSHPRAFRMLAAGKVDSDGRPWPARETAGDVLQRAMRLTAEGHTNLLGWPR